MEVRTQVGRPVEDIPYLVSEEVSKATSRKKTDVKDVVDTLLGPPSLMSQFSMTMPENEEFHKTFEVFAMR